MNSIALTPNGLQRRLKKHLLKAPQQFLAITTPGFEVCLCKELSAFPDIEILKQVTGGVEFSGGIDAVYTLNFSLKTANRILLRIETFIARSYPELFNKCRKIPWELYCGFTNAVSFSVSSKTSRLHHTENIEKAVFEAIQEYMEKLGVRVENKPDAPIRFHIRMSQDECTISIDSSGELLYKRGYRTDTAFAPVRETTACAILMAAGWENYPCIVDPMCGSGTFLIEAARMRLNYASGMTRSFSFENWPSYNASKWNRIKGNAFLQKKEQVSCALYGSDISETAVDASTANASRAGVLPFITFQTADCLSLTPPSDTGLLLSNLPYGKRVNAGEYDLSDFYEKFGKHLRESFAGWDFAFVVADLLFEKKTGLRTNKEIRFHNGGIGVRLIMGRV
ncbi:MAG: hypothetical protein GX640_02915 [Fibrobacter sp.]|nr:hypothetical protein [Fibrobacter sp.]